MENRIVTNAVFALLLSLLWLPSAYAGTPDSSTAQTLPSGNLIKELHQQAQQLREENQSLERQTRVLESWIQVQAQNVLGNALPATSKPQPKSVPRPSPWATMFTAIGGVFLLLIPFAVYKPRLSNKQINVWKHGLKIQFPEKRSLRAVDHEH